MNKIYFVICILMSLVSLTGFAHPAPATPPTNYRFRVSFDVWDGVDMEKWSKVSVFLNGKNIGPVETAFPILEALPLEKGEHVRIDLSSHPEAVTYIRPVCFSSNFIPLWLGKHAVIDMFEDGKALNIHTITWTDFFKDGNFITNLDQATWVIDGKAIGKGTALIKALDKFVREGNAVILYVTPLGSKSPGITVQGEGDHHITLLHDQKKIRLIGVGPDPIFSKKYFYEKINPPRP